MVIRLIQAGRSVWILKGLICRFFIPGFLILLSCDGSNGPTGFGETTDIIRFPGMTPTYGFRDKRPKIRPGTNEISFTRSSSHRYPESVHPQGVYLLDISTLEVRHIADASTFHGDWWSPDTLLYRWYEAWRLQDINTKGYRDIVAAVGNWPSINPIDHSIVFDDGPQLVLLNTETLESDGFGSGCRDPAWHPDGEWFVTAKNSLSGTAYRIITLTRRGALRFEVTEAKPHHFQKFPSWDKAGNRIVFEDEYPDETSHLIPHVVIAAKTGSSSWHIRRLTRGRFPIFDHTGEWVIFSYWSEWNDGEERLFRINVQSGVIQQLTY